MLKDVTYFTESDHRRSRINSNQASFQKIISLSESRINFRMYASNKRGMNSPAFIALGNTHLFTRSRFETSFKTP